MSSWEPFDTMLVSFFPSQQRPAQLLMALHAMGGELGTLKPPSLPVLGL